MFSRLPQALALAAVLLGTAAPAQPEPLRRAAPRTVRLTGQEGESHDIRVAPGFLTTLRLGAPVVREAVEVEGGARFTVDVGEQTLSLEPTAPLERTESRALRVRYRTGSPEFAVFRLIADPAEVDTVITVSRPRPSAEACLTELSTAHERAEAQGRELEQLKALRPAASPAALVLAGLVDKQGVQVDGPKYHKMSPEQADVSLTRLRGVTWAVVLIRGLRNLGQEPWAPAWAEFTPTAGGPVRRARALLSQPVSIAPGESMSLAVEVEVPQRDKTEWFNERHTLALCDAAGRCMTFQDVEL